MSNTGIQIGDTFFNIGDKGHFKLNFGCGICNINIYIHKDFVMELSDLGDFKLYSWEEFTKDKRPPFKKVDDFIFRKDLINC